MLMWSARFGTVPDIPRKRILPRSRRSTSSATESFCSSVERGGLAWNWTTSRCVLIRRKLCSTPARTLERVNTWSRPKPLTLRPRPRSGLVDRAAALAGQEELVPPPRQVLPDELLGGAVVGGGVDVVDPRVQHRVEHLASNLGLDRLGGGTLAASQLHGPVAELSDFQSGASQRGHRQIIHSIPPSSIVSPSLP